MKTIINIRTILLALLIAATGAVFAGNAKRGIRGVMVENIKVKKENRMVDISMTFTLDELYLESNRFITLTPCITDGVKTKALRQLILSGRKQHIKYERERHKLYADAREVLFRPLNRKDVEYAVSVPYEPWMNNAMLVMDEELCGCGREQENSVTELARLLYKVQPLFAYIEPQVEAVKARSEKGSAFLDFRVNRTKIDSTYRNNPEELAKIRETIDKVKSDPDLTINRMTIHGYASPEGSYKNNSRLASRRSESLKEYVLSQYGFDNNLISVSSTPEDWDGLRHMIEESSLDHKEEMLRIIDQTEDPDERNNKLKRIGDGSTYRYMLKEWYPALRHSDYEVHYTIRGFDVEEAKEIIKTRPQKLSLHEMFVVSRQYEPGSEDFNHVFDVAVRMYPEDPTANLNAANIAIGDGVYDKAETYLKKAGDSPEAIHSRGVLAMLREEYEEARALLTRAKELGVEEAEHNLAELDKVD